MARHVEDFADLIHEARHKGRTVYDGPRSKAELAKQCGMSRQFLWLIETGQKRPSARMELRISRVFRMSRKRVAAAIARSYAG